MRAAPLFVDMRFASATRSLALGGIAGVGAGLAAGLGARLAMRLAGWMAQASGAVTVERAVAGDVTWSGTIAVIMIGVMVGVTGGAVYVLARPFLPARLRGLAYGALMLALFGWTILDPANSDFRRFGNAPLNYTIFGALFLAFGIALDALYAKLDARAWTSLWALILWAPIGALTLVLATMNAFFGTDRYPTLGLLAFAVLFALVITASRRTGERRGSATQVPHEG